MERKISLSDVRKAVDSAYENYKSIKEGEVSPQVPVDKPDAFGVAVVLTDGTVVKKGDVDVLSPIGGISRIPVSAVLLSDGKTDELFKKKGSCPFCSKSKVQKPHVGVGAAGVRAVSAVVPQGDREGKMQIIDSMLESMMGSAPVLDDRLYEALKADQEKNKAVDAFAAAGYELYDDTALSLDIYTRLSSLMASAVQLATLGATLAADGRNPITGQYAFDGSIAAPMTALMAIAGHDHKRFVMGLGLPAKRGRAGALLAVLPGFGAIAAYGPRLDERGVSLKGFKAIQEITRTLGLNVFGSARVQVVD